MGVENSLGLCVFSLLRSLIGPENSCLSLNRSDANQIQSQLGPPRFPARQFGRFFFELLLSLKGFFFLLTVVTITLVLVLQHFFYEKFSILQTDTYLLVTQILVMRK